MTKEEAEKIVLEKFPFPNDCYWHIITENKNGFNFNRWYNRGGKNGFGDDEFMFLVQVRHDGSVLKNGQKVTFT